MFRFSYCRELVKFSLYLHWK